MSFCSEKKIGELASGVGRFFASELSSHARCILQWTQSWHLSPHAMPRGLLHLKLDVYRRTTDKANSNDIYPMM